MSKTAAKNEIVVYQPNGSVRLEVMLRQDTVWLNRQQIARLFGRDVKTIGKHIANALQEELAPIAGDADRVVAKFWLLQVFSGDASRLNLTPMVGALATAPLLRASQPLPRDFHTGIFKTASAMPRNTIQYAHKSKTLSTLAVESE